jgi:hypothetical protein
MRAPIPLRFECRRSEVALRHWRHARSPQLRGMSTGTLSSLSPSNLRTTV